MLACAEQPIDISADCEAEAAAWAHKLVGGAPSHRLVCRRHVLAAVV